MNSNQKGLTSLEIMLTVFILIIVGGIGYFVFTQKPVNERHSTSHDANTSNEPEELDSSSNLKKG